MERPTRQELQRLRDVLKLLGRGEAVALADLERLQELGYIVVRGGEVVLTVTGKSLRETVWERGT